MLRYREIYRRMYVDTSRSNIDKPTPSAHIKTANPSEIVNTRTISPHITPKTKTISADEAAKALSNGSTAAGTTGIRNNRSNALTVTDPHSMRVSSQARPSIGAHKDSILTNTKVEI